jgi:deoxyribodipyrimidine photo-lyase
MHNRVRMIVGSFLVKDLLVPWQQGEAWFWDTLVDADLAQNTFNWQWVAGCGADAAPYFRIFNPVRQGQKFDPEGHYVRRWVAELKDLSKDYIHTPWLAKETHLIPSYPDPIIEHSFARDRALNIYKSLKLYK